MSKSNQYSAAKLRCHLDQFSWFRLLYRSRYLLARPTQYSMSASAWKMVIRTSWARFAACQCELFVKTFREQRLYCDDHLENTANNRSVVSTRQKVELCLECGDVINVLVATVPCRPIVLVRAVFAILCYFDRIPDIFPGTGRLIDLEYRTVVRVSLLSVLDDRFFELLQLIPRTTKQTFFLTSGCGY